MGLERDERMKIICTPKEQNIIEEIIEEMHRTMEVWEKDKTYRKFENMLFKMSSSFERR